MSDKNTAPIANRDEALPIISITNTDDERSGSPSKHARSRSGSRRFEQLKSSRAASKIREKLEGLEDKKMENPSTVQDRLLNLLLSQIIPSGDNDDNVIDRRSRKYVDRPGFSLPAMSNNFRRFNARIGPVFVFQNRLIRLFTWRTPSHTISFLAIYTFVCLEPTLLAVLPLVLCLFFIMVPAFLARHPPPPTLLPSELYPLGGPPLAPPPRIKPAPELSKDFFRNMRDLQNSMDDFSKLHDEILKRLSPPTNFSNEALSSTLFISLFMTSLLLFVSAHLLPWRFIFLIAGWATICTNHPRIQQILETAENQKKFSEQEQEAQSQLQAFATADILLDPAPEKREVEIFELQHRDPYSQDGEWEPWVFTPNPYDPLSPAVISGDRPRGTRFFEDVVPPRGWKWADKKWSLDLLSREWVEERCVTGVEVEMEGERWVTDILYDEDQESIPESFKSAKSTKSAKGKEKERKGVVTWEEGSGKHKLGEWRRRRWVRIVERVVVEAGKDDGRVFANE